MDRMYACLLAYLLAGANVIDGANFIDGANVMDGAQGRGFKGHITRKSLLLTAI